MRAFRHRDFRLFWCGQLVSLVGTWMQSVAQAWLVLELTGSPLRLGLVSALQFTPMLLLSFLAGALADRLPKRRLIIASQTAPRGTKRIATHANTGSIATHASTKRITSTAGTKRITSSGD